MEDWPSVPPGFSSLTSFVLQRVQDDARDSINGKIDNPETIKKFRRSLRHRPWVNYGKFDDSSEEEDSALDLSHQRPSSIQCLPKGVVKGCSEDASCERVVARWRPNASCKPILDEAPVFHPTEEEFKDSLSYIESIRVDAEKYGICRIIPPSSWKPPCHLKEKDMWQHSKFVARVQQIDKLQNRETAKRTRQAPDIIMEGKRQKLLEADKQAEHQAVERFGFVPGLAFTLESFHKYADSFKEQYFQSEKKESISVDDVEGEYWRIVEKPTEAIEVLYGADLDTATFGSGFPKESSDAKDAEYVKSGWNLNNIPRLPGSVLCFEDGNIPGVQVPWLYVGMCFSSFCWHVEDHHLYSLNYHHMGAPKVWYGVPAYDAIKLESAMKKHLPDLFEEQPDLLHNLVTQFFPSLLKKEGVSVYRCVQHEGEFVLTFPRAYHSGFNCGFNCAEAVNVAPVDWLPHGQTAVELYREQKRNITLSHDKLLLGAANEAVRAHWEMFLLRINTPHNLRWKRLVGDNGILTRTLYARNTVEQTRRKYLCIPSQCRKMDAGFDATERECVVCHFDLYLSAAGCSTCTSNFACLIHAKELCTCNWSTRYFLFRYDDAELSLLLDALGGKLSAVHRWGMSYLGLSLSSSVPKDKAPPIPKPLLTRLVKQSISMDKTAGDASSLVDSPQQDQCSSRQGQSVLFMAQNSGDNQPTQRSEAPAEPLEYGVVLPGKLWSTSRAIYPKGYTSRVRYWSVMEADKMCYYVSKILDAGLEGPLFMVSVEESPSEVFVRSCPDKCWNLVRERVMQENEKSYVTMKKSGIVPKSSSLLQDPGPIDGLEMFGLSSPQVLQALEALDDGHVCWRYWDSKLELMEIRGTANAEKDQNDPLVRKKDPSHNHILQGLFKKGSLEELHALQTILGDATRVNSRIEANKLLSEEIKSRHC